MFAQVALSQIIVVLRCIRVEQAFKGFQDLPFSISSPYPSCRQYRKIPFRVICAMC
jgi:hypothetical protein